MRDPESRSRELDSDDELIRRVAARDLAAFEALFRRYHRRLFAFVHRLIRRGDLVEEAVSDTLLAVWRQADGFDHRSRLSSWIFGIAYRRALKALERDTRRRRGEQDLETAAESVDPTPGPEARASVGEAAGALARALRELPAEQRAVVELTFVAGCSYAEIAVQLGCPVNTVKTRMYHARRRLRARLPELAAAFGGTDREADR
jgi:RNA polymerase sigma-70 factor (ECF subfamily)